MKKSNFFILFPVFLLWCSCTPTKKTISAQEGIKQVAYIFAYDLNQPDVAFELPKSLREISGIALINEQEIVAIQDENGVLFFIDKHTGKIIRETPFHKDGDYEDIAVVDSVIYVIKSNGSLYKLEPTPVDNFIRTKYKVTHDKEHDMEGLCYDKSNNRLLIACKGKLSTEDKYHKHKGLSAFNLSTFELEEEPAFSISLEILEAYISTKGSPEMREKFSKIMSDNDGDLGFAPSAVAIHPFSKNIYIASSKGKTLIVVHPDGTILYMEKLDKEIHRQPEGMFFDIDGTLYISNEGKDENGRIYRFNMRQNN